MTDIPLRGSVDRENSIQTDYVPGTEATSDLPVRPWLDRLPWLVWAILFAINLVFVWRFALVNPYVDEWAFVPAWFGERPLGPWLWELHNEHRFPLPRLIYIGLFRLTGDLRTGCYFNSIGIALVAALLIRLAQRVRGRAAWTDVIFPLMLVHVGFDENLYMGYQLCFLLVTALAVLFLVTMHVTTESNHFRRGLQAGAIGLALLACGAAGLVYGGAALTWMFVLALRGRMLVRQRIALGVLAAVVPIYIFAYVDGYVRPAHHPASAGVLESARIALQAQAIAFGPAAQGLWPAIGFAIVACGALAIGQLIRPPIGSATLKNFGLILFLLAGGAVAFGIGWGRSGFHADMGFAWRYGWLTAPVVCAAYITWVGRRDAVSRFGPAVLALFVASLFQVNEISGFLDGERKVRPLQLAWEADVRAGVAAPELVDRHFPNSAESFRAEVIVAVQLMRARRYEYYSPEERP